MHRIPTALLLGALLAAAPAPPAEAAKAKRCFAKKSERRTVLVSDRMRVYRRGETEESEPTFWACWRRTGHVMRLGEESIASGFGGFRAAGRYLAFQEDYYDRGTGDVSVHVHLVDVAGRRVIRDLGHQLYAFSRPGEQLKVRGERLAADGRHAYLVGEVTSGTNAQATEFLVVVNGKVADAGPDVDPASFASSGDTVTWRRGGQPRSAPF